MSWNAFVYLILRIIFSRIFKCEFCFFNWPHTNQKLLYFHPSALASLIASTGRAVLAPWVTKKFGFIENIRRQIFSWSITATLHSVHCFLIVIDECLWDSYTLCAYYCITIGTHCGLSCRLNSSYFHLSNTKYLSKHSTDKALALFWGRLVAFRVESLSLCRFRSPSNHSRPTWPSEGNRGSCSVELK